MSHKLQPGRFAERIEKLKGLIELPDDERVLEIRKLPLDKRIAVSLIMGLLKTADWRGYEFVGMGAETIVMRQDDVVRKYLWLSDRPHDDAERVRADYLLQRRFMGAASIVRTTIGTERVFGRRMCVQEQPYLGGAIDWRNLVTADRPHLRPAMREFAVGAQALRNATGLLVDVAGQGNLVVYGGILQQLDIGLIRPYEETPASLGNHNSSHQQLVSLAIDA